MKVADQQLRLNEDVIRELRLLASQGATVPHLVQTIQTRLGYKEDAVLPILWYFTATFCLPLPVVLPLREWFVQRNDEAIDAQLLPAIARTQAEWQPISKSSTDNNGAIG